MSPQLQGLIKSLLGSRIYTLTAIRWRMSFRGGAVLSSSLYRKNICLEKRRGICEFELQQELKNHSPGTFCGPYCSEKISHAHSFKNLPSSPLSSHRWVTAPPAKEISFWQFLLTSVPFPPPQHTCWVFARLLSLSKGTPGPWAGNPGEVS